MALVNRIFKKQTYLIPDSLTYNSSIITALIGINTYSVTLSSLTANTLYFLYLRNGGSTALYYSTTVPSSYRSSYPEAILVGAFYSNGVTGSIAFGSFVCIEGAPQTDWISYTSNWTATTTNPTIVNGSKAAWYKRTGDTGFYRILIAPGSSDTFGSGSYRLDIPQQFYSGKMGTGDNTAMGLARTTKSGVNAYLGVIERVDSTKVGVRFQMTNSGTNPVTITNTTIWTPTNPISLASGDLVVLEFYSTIFDWSDQNKSLKDL